MDPKLKDLIAQTNRGDLLQPANPQVLGGPTIITGLVLLDIVLRNDNATLFGKAVGALFCLGIIAFWPLIIYAKRRKTSDRAR